MEIVEIIPNCEELDLDKYVKQYMSIYSVDNVRGGSYTDVDLDNEILISLQEEINNVSGDECYKCGDKYHLASQCTNIDLSCIDLDAKELAVIHGILERIAKLKALDGYLLKSYSNIFKAYIQHHVAGIEPNQTQLDELRQDLRKTESLEIQVNMIDIGVHLNGFNKTIENLNKIADEISKDPENVNLSEIDNQLTLLFKYLRFIYGNNTYVDNFQMYFVACDK